MILPPPVPSKAPTSRCSLGRGVAREAIDFVELTGNLVSAAGELALEAYTNDEIAGSSFVNRSMAMPRAISPRPVRNQARKVRSEAR